MLVSSLSSIVVLLVNLSVLAHPVQLNDVSLISLRSNPNPTNNTNQGPVNAPSEPPSVPTRDIIHDQGPGVFPCSGKPDRTTAKDCAATIKDAQLSTYGFIPEGGSRQCMKPRSVTPDAVMGACYTKPVRDDKKDIKDLDCGDGNKDTGNDAGQGEVTKLGEVFQELVGNFEWL